MTRGNVKLKVIVLTNWVGCLIVKFCIALRLNGGRINIENVEGLQVLIDLLLLLNNLIALGELLQILLSVRRAKVPTHQRHLQSLFLKNQGSILS